MFFLFVSLVYRSECPRKERTIKQYVYTP